LTPALKGHPQISPGQRPGRNTSTANVPALKGRNNRSEPNESGLSRRIATSEGALNCAALSGHRSLRGPFPRALPWADLLSPFGAKSKMRNIKTGASGWCGHDRGPGSLFTAGCLVPHISISFAHRGGAGQPRPRAGKPRVGRDGDSRVFVPTEYHFVPCLKHLPRTRKPNSPLHLRRRYTPKTDDGTEMTAYGSAKDPIVRKAIEPFDQGSFNPGMRGMTRKRSKSKVAPPFPCSSVRSVVQVLEFLTPGRER
jgi:hypothetical protein